MADAYTTLWTNDVCGQLIKEGFAGERLSILFGGPHGRCPVSSGLD